MVTLRCQGWRVRKRVQITRAMAAAGFSFFA
jgi:hypothetical protein